MVKHPRLAEGAARANCPIVSGRTLRRQENSVRRLAIVALAIIALALSLPGVLPASASNPQDALQALYMLRATVEVCKTPLTADELARLTKAEQKALAESGFDAPGAQDFHGRIKTAFSEWHEYFCDPTRPWQLGFK
jgi:hypothetical protein